MQELSSLGRSAVSASVDSLPAASSSPLPASSSADRQCLGERETRKDEVKRNCEGTPSARARAQGKNMERECCGRRNGRDTDECKSKRAERGRGRSSRREWRRRAIRPASSSNADGESRLPVRSRKTGNPRALDGAGGIPGVKRERGASGYLWNPARPLARDSFSRSP